MSLDACARLVEKGDPDRFLATMSASPEARDRLWPLYAYNLEIARAPWASREPMIAEMRLQWWVDTLDAIAAGKTHQAHEVAGPLSTLIQERGLDTGALRAMAEARFWDVWQEPFADTPALVAYLDATSGNLMMEAARALGADAASEPAIRDLALASGIASWLRAVPVLVARGRYPLPADSEPVDLARRGMEALARARQGRATVPRAAAPAMLAAWQAGPTLRAALHAPEKVWTGLPVPAEFTRRGALVLRSMTGFW